MKKVTIVKYGKKSAQEQCTRVHNSITGRPLTDRYTLVYYSFIKNVITLKSNLAPKRIRMSNKRNNFSLRRSRCPRKHLLYPSTHYQAESKSQNNQFCL